MVHFVSHIAISYAISLILKMNPEQTAMFVLANLIDIDHMFDGNMCDAVGTTFDNNFFHQNWPLTILAFSVIHPYLGMGVSLHFYLDYLDALAPSEVACEDVPKIPGLKYALSEIGL